MNVKVSKELLEDLCAKINELVDSHSHTKYRFSVDIKINARKNMIYNVQVSEGNEEWFLFGGHMPKTALYTKLCSFRMGMEYGVAL